MKSLLLLQVASVLLTGLSAGLFYGYACSVNKGLGQLPDKEYLAAFQSINSAIQNPVFFLSFIGSFLALCIAAVWSYNFGEKPVFYFLLAALIVYSLGVLGVTITGNIPLNEEVARLNLSEALPDTLSQMRQRFEKPWNNFHTVRTVAAIFAFGLSTISLVKL